MHQSRIKNSFPEESVPPAEALFVVFGALVCNYPLRVFSPAPMTDATASSTIVSISKGHRIVIYLRI